MKLHIKTAVEWQEIVTQKDNEIDNLQKQVTWLTLQFKLMQSRQFASSSEKTMDVADQLSLFNEAEAAVDSDIPEPELEKIVYTRKKAKGQAGKWIFRLAYRADYS